MLSVFPVAMSLIQGVCKLIEKLSLGYYYRRSVLNFIAYYLKTRLDTNRSSISYFLKC